MATKKRFRDVKPETEETPDQFVIRLKNYLAKWVELSGSISGDFEALLDLIVKKWFINACSEKLAVNLLERRPKNLVELTTWAQQYLISHKQQLGARSSLQSSPKCAEQQKPTQSKLHVDTTPRKAKVATVLQMPRLWSHACVTKVSFGNDQKS